MGHYETLRTEKLGVNHDLYLALKAKLMHKKSTEGITINNISDMEKLTIADLEKMTIAELGG